MNKTQQIALATSTGYDAFNSGEERDANPYAETEPDMRRAWFFGYDEAVWDNDDQND